jgi:hypothetical protein
MKLTTLFFSITLAASAANITIDVHPALAPNGFGSPSYTGWLNNAFSALSAGAASAGTPGTPSYYQQRDFYDGSEILVTSFNSWLGHADPGTYFGPAFASELGNRLLFGLVIDGHGNKFSISQLSFTATSTDPSNVLGFSFGAGSYNYGGGYYGIIDDGDGIYGNGSDTIVTGGPNTQLVDALIGRGSGNALWPCGPGDPHPCSTTPERQTALDDTANYNNHGQYLFTGAYRLMNGTEELASGSATATINPVPEPAAFTFVAGGLALILLGRFRRR